MEYLNQENSGSVFVNCGKLTSVDVLVNYKGDTFCGKPVNKTFTPEKPVNPVDPVDPDKPKKPSKKGKSKAGIIAGSVVAEVVVVAIVVTIVMYLRQHRTVVKIKKVLYNKTMSKQMTLSCFYDELAQTKTSKKAFLK